MPEAAPRFAEIVLTAKPALLECRNSARREAAASSLGGSAAAAAAAALALASSSSSSPASDDAASSSSGSEGDTFLIRAYSADVLLPENGGLEHHVG